MERYGRFCFFEKNDFFPIDTVYFVRPNEDKVLLEYSYYLLKSLPLSSLNTDAAVPGLNRDRAYALPIRIPKLDQQKRIVGFISNYDDSIENNRRRIQLLEESARLLYQEWFVHLRFPGHEQVKVTDGVPEGWQRIKVKDLGDVITGKTPSTKDAGNFGEFIQFIKTPDMHDSSIVIFPSEYLSEKGAASQKNKTLSPNSILVACIGAKLGVVSLNAFPCQTNQQINAVVPKASFLTYFAYFILKDFRPRLLAIGGGATMPNVNKAKFENMDLVLPSNNLLEMFQSFSEPVFEQVKTLLLENYKLVQARDLLLPKLMSGELTV